MMLNDVGPLFTAVDTPYHPVHTNLSARISSGALCELVDQIVQGKLHNGFAASES